MASTSLSIVNGVTPSSITDVIAGTVDPLTNPPADTRRELPAVTTIAFVVMADTDVADFLIVCSGCAGVAPPTVQARLGVRLMPVAVSAGVGVPGTPGSTVIATLAVAVV